MKITFRYLSDRCRVINPSLRDTPFGLALDHVRSDIAVLRMPRDPSCRVPFVLFQGSAREVDAYLTGLDSSSVLRMPIVDPDEQDGSDAG